MANIELEYPDAMSFLLEGKARYRVAYGGRGSSKSWSAARALLILAMKSKIRILCAREVQRSIKDSVHRLLSDQIEAMGIGEYFEILQNEIKCTRTGSHFIFAGLANTTAESLKSIENVKVCWVEEAQTVSDRSWEILIPTIRASGSEIWVTFNPSEATDPTYVRFITHPPPDAIVRRVNWYDNPWFPEELKKEKDYLYSVDPEAAAHVWGGECRKFGDAQVLRGKYSVETFEPWDYWDGPYQGADWGFAVDPSTLVRVWIWERKLYVEYEAYGLGTEIDHTPALFDAIPDARSFVTRADNARPETISYMIRNGWPRMEPVYKWKGSVEDGVQYLRAFDQIVIHPRCPHTAEEARLWSFKTDKLSGDILPELLDKHNHCLIGATLVMTQKGSVPISQIKAGDQVLTRAGFKNVIRAWMSGTNREVMRVETVGGRVLYGTPDHEIYTSRGLVRMDGLRYKDVVLGLEGPKEQGKKPCSIVRYGLTTSVQSPKGFISTIKIMILTTIRRITSKLCHRHRIEASTLQRGTKNTKNRLKSIFRISKSRPQNGIGQTKGVCGTESMLEEIQGLMTSTMCAQFAEALSGRTDMRGVSLVVDCVLVACQAFVAKEVYDLTVEDQHEFFADEILVSNCWDGIRYALTPMILGHAKKNPRPPAIDEEFPGMYCGGCGNSWMA